MTQQLRANNAHAEDLSSDPAPAEGSSQVPVIAVPGSPEPLASLGTYMHILMHVHAHTHVHTSTHTCTHINTGFCFVCCVWEKKPSMLPELHPCLFKHFVLKWGLAKLPRPPSTLVILPQLGLQACLTVPANSCSVLIMFCKLRREAYFIKLCACAKCVSTGELIPLCFRICQRM